MNNYLISKYSANDCTNNDLHKYNSTKNIHCKKPHALMRYAKVSAFLAVSMISTTISALTLSAKEGVPQLELYGFLKADAILQDSGMNHSYAPRYATENGTGDGDGEFNMTAMHSRFGFKWKGLTFDSGTQLSAQLEWDLFDGSANQMQFRDRLASVTVARDKHALLIGQHWDLFSPLNVTTLQTNGNFWQTGNLGFRRAQFRYTYQGSLINFAASINDGTSDGIRKDKKPLLEARLGATFERSALGLSVASGKEIINDTGYDIKGVSLDWKLGFSDHFSIQGEAANGENLKAFLSRSGTATNVTSGILESQEVESAWVQLLYKGDQCHLWLGAAFEELDNATLSDGNLEQTQALFLGFKHSYGKGFSAAIEASKFESTLTRGSTEDANQVIVSAIYGF